MLSSGRKPSGAEAAVVERVLRNGKRMYVHQFKLALVRRCLEPGVSVSAVALEHGINANLLRKWIDKHRDEAGVRGAPALLPVSIEPSEMASPATAPMIAAPAPREAGAAIECQGSPNLPHSWSFKSPHPSSRVDGVYLNDPFGQIGAHARYLTLNRAPPSFHLGHRSCNLLHGLPLSKASD